MSKAKMDSNKVVKVLSTKGYDRWEVSTNGLAYDIAKEIIKDYNDGVRHNNWTIEQSKPVIEYTLMKVWHICSSSGIFIDYKVAKIKDKCKIIINFYEQDPEYVD
jgi:hypothetical protein